MPRKHALLIANTEYRDGKLAGMAHPGLAYAELADALKDPARGAFAQVETLVNANPSHALNALDRFFSRKPADDILLVYVGAHCFVDAQGELYLALKDSDRFRLKSTALMAAVLGMNMDQSPSPHKLLLLDCRIHSPYQDSRSPQDPARVDPARVFAGRGLPKRILSAAEPPREQPAPAPTSSTQKLQVTAQRDFTRALADTLRAPSTVPGGRSAFTVEDWWNDVAAELKSGKAEPPQRLAVGEPPVTVLRGASLPRPELALSPGAPGNESVTAAPTLPHEPETEWSRLSGIFPLEMFAPDLAASAGKPERAERAGKTERVDRADASPPQEPRGDQTIIADPTRFVGGADLVLRARQGIETSRPMDFSDPDSGTLESPIASSPTVEVPLPEASASLAADAAGAPPPGTRGPVHGNPRDTFTDLRARLRTQEEQERQAGLEAEREEAAQREKLNQWKARWDARSAERDAAGKPGPSAPRPAEGKPAPEAAPPAESPQARNYRSKIAALQKTMYVPPPDAGPDAETRAQPAPQAAPAEPLLDGTATVMVSKDQFLNTGVHKVPMQLTPGATIRVSKEEFFGNSALQARTQVPAPGTGAQAAAVQETALKAPSQKPAETAAPTAAPAAGRETARFDRETDTGRGAREAREAREAAAAPKPPKPPKPSRPPRGPAGGRRTALWVLAGLVPVGLVLLLYFGTKAGLFWSLGLGPDPAVKRAEEAQRAAADRLSRDSYLPATPVAPDLGTSEEEIGVILPAESASVSAPPSDAAAAPAPGIPAVKPAPVPAAAATAPAAPAAPAAAIPAPAKPGKKAPAAPAQVAAAAPARPAASPARRAETPSTPPAAVRPAAQPKPSLRPDRAAQEAERIARAQYRQDSLKAFRVYRDSLLTARAQAMQDSILQVRVQRERERAQKAEADGLRLAAEQARKDSLRAAKDSVQAETLLRKSVTQAMKANTEEMRSLYNRFALGYPGLQGDVVINLLVAPNGEIEKGAVHSSTTGIRMFDQLVLGNVMEWRIRPFKARGPKAILVAVKFPIAAP